MPIQFILFRKLKYQKGSLVQGWICWYVRGLRVWGLLKIQLEQKTATTTRGSHKRVAQVDRTNWQHFPGWRGWPAGFTCQGRHPPLGLSAFSCSEWTRTALLHTMWAFQTPLYLSPGPSAFTRVTAWEKVIEVPVGYSPNWSHLPLRLFLYMSPTLKGGAHFPCILTRTLAFRDFK